MTEFGKQGPYNLHHLSLVENLRNEWIFFTYSHQTIWMMVSKQTKQRADMADKSTRPPLTQKRLANSNALLSEIRDF